MIKHKNKIIWGLLIVAVLSFTFWYGGDAPGLRGWAIHSESQELSPKSKVSVSSEYITPTPKEQKINPILPTSTNEDSAEKDPAPQTETKNENPPTENDVITDESSEEEQNHTAPVTEEPQNANPTEHSELTTKKKTTSDIVTANKKEDTAEKDLASQAKTEHENIDIKNTMIIDPNTGKDQYLTDPVPEGKPVPVEPQNVDVSDQALSCTLSVRCDSILQHMEWLDPEKVELVPKDGVIYAEQTVVFYDGENVFDVLLREMKQNRIHMEFEHTPLYNSSYIEGIANLYEFDCGELSGWMYRVNDWFPNYGCSRYQLKDGDRIEWLYTCELGRDIGGSAAITGN